MIWNTYSALILVHRNHGFEINHLCEFGLKCLGCLFARSKGPIPFSREAIEGSGNMYPISREIGLKTPPFFCFFSGKSSQDKRPNNTPFPRNWEYTCGPLVHSSGGGDIISSVESKKGAIKVYGDSTLLVLKRTYMNIDSALLALKLTR